MNGVVLVFACFLAGWMLTSWWAGALKAAKPLELWVIWAALPALVLVKMPTVPLGHEAIVPIAGAWAVAAVAAAAVLIAARVFDWDALTTGALMLVVPLGNTGFLGIAATRALLGEDHVALALTYDQLGTFLLLVTYGTVIASRYGTAESGAWVMVRKVITFPPFIALVVSIALRHWHLSQSMNDVLSAVGKTVSYCAMLALGLRFRLAVTRKLAGPAAIGIATRMIVVPAFVMVAAYLLGDAHSVSWEATQLQAAMPPMIVAGLLAASSGLNAEASTFVVGTGTILSFATLPVAAALIN